MFELAWRTWSTAVLDRDVQILKRPRPKKRSFSASIKNQIQALDRTQPGLPIKRGRCGTMPHDYKRHGVTLLFAALDVAEGTISGQCYGRHHHQDFLRFLKRVGPRSKGVEQSRARTRRSLRRPLLMQIFAHRVRPSSRATTLIFSPSRRHRSRRSSRFHSNYLGRPSRRCLVSLRSSPRGSSCFMRPGFTFSGAPGVQSSPPFLGRVNTRTAILLRLARSG